MATLTTAIQMATARRLTTGAAAWITLSWIRLAVSLRSWSAVLDGEEDTEMQPCQPGTVPVDKAVAMRADDIGHLERWPRHFLCSLRDRFTRSRFDSSALSSGVPAAFR
jgi:hypothetical protein